MKNEGINRDSATGYLVVRVMTGNGAIPLEGALVTIYSGQEKVSQGASVLPGDAFITVQTDRSGSTARLELPAPAASLSSRPSEVKPFSVYNISVILSGYERQYFYGVPVFAGITSIQPVLMKPFPENANEQNFSAYDVRTYEGVTPDL